MAPLKCCVVGCDSTAQTHKLFCMPMNDNLRNLWMSFLVPVNSHLLGLTKGQLMTKRVCDKHFDETQFDPTGARIRYSYPCLFTEKEIFHGVPLCSEEYNVLHEHNYHSEQGQDDDSVFQEPVVIEGMSGDVHLQEHHYSLPATSQMATLVQSKDEGGVSTQEQQHAAASPTILSSKDNSKRGSQDDPALLEQQELIPSPTNESNTVKSTSVIEGLSSSRTPLTNITHQENLNVKRKFCQTPQPSVSGLAVADTLLETRQKSNVDGMLLHASNSSKQPTSKGKTTIKQFRAKTRRFIKVATKLATDSLGQTATDRLQNALQHANQDLIQNFDSLNKKAKSFLLMQLRLARKNKMARRFSLDDKLFALALMKQSPKGYKLLENIFALPTKRTLARLSSKIIFECGINKNTFDHIKENVKHWGRKERLCSLVFDEVALTPRLVYNESKDEIEGFEEIAGERRQKFADHALVFMIRGICSPWRQCIAYYFCAGTVAAAELEKILKELIPRISDAGLKPLALVCDQGSTFRACFKNLKATTARMQTSHKNPYDTVHVAGHDLFIFHDPPHLLKSIRNNFLDKDIIFKGKRASWKDIVYVYDMDMQSGHSRALPKLTAEHVDPKKIKKMKVKMAAQVLSARTAAMLEFTHSLHKNLNAPTETMDTTAAAIRFFDDLFDSVNGSPGQVSGKLRRAVKANSEHGVFWKQALETLKDITFVDRNSKMAIRSGKPRYVRVPCLEGWMTTLNSFIEITKFLMKEYDVEYLYPRIINQDPLENFFGRIRAINYRNTNPDVSSFIYSFKSLVISNILAPHSKHANCEDDDGETIINVRYLFSPGASEEKENLAPEYININPNLPSSSTPRTSREAVVTEKIKVQTSAYTAGYICRKLSEKNKCNACVNTYTTKEIEGIHDYIQFREYKRLKHNNLAYPTGKMVRLYRECAGIIHNFLNVNCHQKNIKKSINDIIIKQCDISWLGCQEHKELLKTNFINCIIRLQVHNWCNIINRILNGQVEEKYVMKMHTMHQLALKKYKSHRLRQKATKNI